MRSISPNDKPFLMPIKNSSLKRVNAGNTSIAIALPTPPIAVFNLVRLSLNCSAAFAASLVITPPSFCNSSPCSRIAAEPWLSIGIMFAPARPKMETANAVLFTPSSIPTNLSATSNSICWLVFIEPSVFLNAIPRAFNPFSALPEP